MHQLKVIPRELSNARSRPYDESPTRHRHINELVKEPARDHAMTRALGTGKSSKKQELLKNKNRNGTLKEQLEGYKYDLVNDLNRQMSEIDNEVIKNMDELSEDFHDRAKVIAEAGQSFLNIISEDRVEIHKNDSGMQQMSLGEVMADLGDLIKQKTTRLEELTTEHITIHHQMTELATAILGSENVHLVEPSPNKHQQVSRHQIDSKKLAVAGECNKGLDLVYQDAGTQLEALKTELDALVSQYGEENKTTLKTYQASRTSKQRELSKLLSSWTIS